MFQLVKGSPLVSLLYVVFFVCFAKFSYGVPDQVFPIVLILFSCPLESWVSLWYFDTIRGSLMKPKWQKLASLAQKICTL